MIHSEDPKTSLSLTPISAKTPFSAKPKSATSGVWANASEESLLSRRLNAISIWERLLDSDLEIFQKRKMWTECSEYQQLDRILIKKE